MANNTTIEWTDKTWNMVTGCTKVSPGCANCYAEGIEKRFKRSKSYMPGEGKVVLHPERLEEPLRVKKPSRIFAPSMSDLFHEDVPDEFIDKVIALIALTGGDMPLHTYQVLTKRPERMAEYFNGSRTEDRVSDAAWDMMNETGHYPGAAMQVALGRGRLAHQWPPRNLWLGVSVENQTMADQRIPLLFQTPAAVRFVSYEPALAKVDFEDWLTPLKYHPRIVNSLHQIIVGGESGPGARPPRDASIEDIMRATLEQCRAAGIAYFGKQMGTPWARQNGVYRKGNAAGGDWSTWPQDLRVREFPTRGKAVGAHEEGDRDE